MAQTLPDAVVLGADTLVALTITSGKTSGPRRCRQNVAAPERPLARGLDGGLPLLLGLEKSENFCVVSRVKFRDLTDRAIRIISEKIDPLDKAGAYAAQGHGKEIIKRIDGSYSNCRYRFADGRDGTALLGAFGITRALSRAFAAADLQLVSVRIFKKHRVVAGAVLQAKLRTFHVFSARLADDFGHLIDGGAALRPKCNAICVRFVIGFFLKAKNSTAFSPAASNSPHSSPLLSRLKPIAGRTCS